VRAGTEGPVVVTVSAVGWFTGRRSWVGIGHRGHRGEGEGGRGRNRAGADGAVTGVDA
jgi:hypothetical protein